MPAKSSAKPAVKKAIAKKTVSAAPAKKAAKKAAPQKIIAKTPAAATPVRAATPAKKVSQNLTVKAFIQAVHALRWSEAIDHRTYLRASTHMIFLLAALALVAVVLVVLLDLLKLPEIVTLIPLFVAIVPLVWLMYTGIKVQVARVHSFGIRGIWYILYLIAFMCITGVYGYQEENGIVPSLTLHFLTVVTYIVVLVVSWYLYFVPGTAQTQFRAVKIYPTPYISWPVRIILPVLLLGFIVESLTAIVTFLTRL